MEPIMLTLAPVPDCLMCGRPEVHHNDGTFCPSCYADSLWNLPRVEWSECETQWDDD